MPLSGQFGATNMYLSKNKKWQSVESKKKIIESEKTTRTSNQNPKHTSRNINASPFPYWVGMCVPMSGKLCKQNIRCKNKRKNTKKELCNQNCSKKLATNLCNQQHNCTWQFYLTKTKKQNAQRPQPTSNTQKRLFNEIQPPPKFHLRITRSKV